MASQFILQEYDEKRMRNQVFQAITKVLFLLALVGCGGAAAENAPPTPIAATAVSADNTPTSAAQSAVSTAPAQPTPTLVHTPDSAEPTGSPTATPLPPGNVANGRSIGDPYSPELGNTGYDAQHYTIRIALDPAVTQVQAVMTMAAVATDDITQLSLDFVGFEIDRLQVDGTDANFTRAEDKLLVDLPQPLLSGTPFTMVVSYRGTPVAEPSPYAFFAPALGLRYVSPDSIYVLSEPDGARYWFPNNDHPRDKATYRFEVTVPVGLTAVANGELTAINATGGLPLPNGTAGHTFVWEHNFPMASYLATIAVGMYERIEDVSPNGVPIRHYLFPEYAEEFERATSITGEAIDWMSDLFGPYPFENIGFVTADAPGVSLETQTTIIMSTGMIGQVTVIHELAHMWFGDWVSLDSWSEMWRNEGFATYVSLMWEHRGDPEGLDLEIEAIKTAVSENEPSYPLGSPPRENLFGFNTYFGGAVVVHELRQTIGDDAFFAGLQTYFQTYGGRTASDAEFQAIMEQASSMSLDAFFAKWLDEG